MRAFIVLTLYAAAATAIPHAPAVRPVAATAGSWFTLGSNLRVADKTFGGATQESTVTTSVRSGHHNRCNRGRGNCGRPSHSPTPAPSNSPSPAPSPSHMPIINPPHKILGMPVWLFVLLLISAILGSLLCCGLKALHILVLARKRTKVNVKPADPAPIINKCNCRIEMDPIELPPIINKCNCRVVMDPPKPPIIINKCRCVVKCEKPETCKSSKSCKPKTPCRPLKPCPPPPSLKRSSSKKRPPSSRPPSSSRGSSRKPCLYPPPSTVRPPPPCANTRAHGHGSTSRPCCPPSTRRPHQKKYQSKSRTEK